MSESRDQSLELLFGFDLGFAALLNLAQARAAMSQIIWAAAAALPPPQRAAFQERVAAELKSLPCGMMGPGSLHRIIATAQQTFLRAGAVAVGPSPKHGKPNAVAARARAKRAC